MSWGSDYRARLSGSEFDQISCVLSIRIRVFPPDARARSNTSREVAARRMMRGDAGSLGAERALRLRCCDAGRTHCKTRSVEQHRSGLSAQTTLKSSGGRVNVLSAQTCCRAFSKRRRAAHTSAPPFGSRR